MADPERPESAPETGETSRADAPPHHQMWVTQADELARLRDEVRAAAEREAMDVVATARRRIRQVITEARRDLLVLNAQLHATLGPTGPPPDAAALPPGAGFAGPDDGVRLAGLTPRDAERHAAVQAALDRAKAGIEALAQELDDIDVPVETPPRRLDPQPEPASTAQTLEHAPLPVDPGPVDPGPVHPPRSSGHTDESSVRGMPWRPHADLVPASALADTSSSRGSGRRLMLAAGLAGAILLTTGIVWLWPGGEPGASRGVDAVTPVEERAAIPPPVDTADDAAPPPATAQPEGLSIVLNVIDEPAWIRTIVDGRTEARTYEPGEMRRIEGARQVSLRTGNAGAVQISVNGAPPERLGAHGAIANRQFSLAPPPPAAGDASRASPAPDRPASTESAVTTPRSATPAGLPPASSAMPAGRPAMPGADAGTLPATELAPRVPAPAPPPAPLPSPSMTAAPQVDQPPSPTTEEDEGEINVAIAGQQWLDAYHRQDASVLTTLASPSATVRDERQPGERFPEGVPGIARRFDDVSVEFAGDIAIYTARVTERRTDTAGAEHVSRVAQIWTRRAGRWQLTDVRIMSDARVGQLVR